MKYFEVFRAGSYPQGVFTKEQISDLAKNYDPEFCESPITLDHEQKGPAYGWVSGLKCENGKLKASFRDVSDELKDYVKAGKYKKVSVEIYRNLEGKSPYLKAITFLGASIPQVKGMEAVEFKEGESDVFIFEQELDSDVIDDPQTYPADDIKPNPDIAQMQSQIDDLSCQVMSFVDKNGSNELVSKLQNQISKMSEQLAGMQDDSMARQKAEQELSRLRLQMRRNDFEQFLNEQIAYGSLTPAQKELSLKTLLALDSVPHFSESDTDPVAAFQELIKSLPKQVELGEIATKEDGYPQDDESDTFENASEESIAMFKEAKALAAKDNIDFKSALLKINKV